MKKSILTVFASAMLGICLFWTGCAKNEVVRMDDAIGTPQTKGMNDILR